MIGIKAIGRIIYGMFSLNPYLSVAFRASIFSGFIVVMYVKFFFASRTNYITHDIFPLLPRYQYRQNPKTQIPIRILAICGNSYSIIRSLKKVK
jgi:hypothetical protein